MEGEGNEVKHSMLWEEIAPGVNKKPNLINGFGMDLGNFDIVLYGESGELKSVYWYFLNTVYWISFTFFSLQIDLFD